MSRFSEKTAVITGASSGIGSGIALALANEGAKVVVNYNRSEKNAEQVVKIIADNGGQAWAIQADISNPEGIKRLIEESSTKMGNIDIWVNNAGADILTGELARESDENKLHHLLQVDLLGTMNCCWSILPHMQKQGYGCLVNMSWDLATHGFIGRNPEMFSAVKAGVLGFSKSLARSCAPDIRVNVVAPGWIETAFASDSMKDDYYQSRVAEIPMARFGKPSDVANAVLFLASEEATYITGQVINVNGGLV